MEIEAYTVFAILAGAVVLFAFEWVPPEVVAVLTLVSLAVFGILTPQEAFAGFSSNAVIAIAALLVISAGLVRSGAVKWLAGQMEMLAGSRYSRILLVSTAAPGIISGFINIVASVSIFIPAILRLARRNKMGSADKQDISRQTALIAASASFLMPVGHPAPLLVRKPGGYRNIDYLKFGFGPALFLLAVVAVVVPLFW